MHVIHTAFIVNLMPIIFNDVQLKVSNHKFIIYKRAK